MPVQEALNGESGSEVTAQMRFGVAFHEISHSHWPGHAAGVAALRNVSTTLIHPGSIFKLFD